MKTTTTLIDRFGSNRMNATEPGKLLRGCTCIAVPFAGGMCEIPHFTANIVLVNDLDRAVINCAAVVADEELCAELKKALDDSPFHPDLLSAAQQKCKKLAQHQSPYEGENNLAWAFNYFVASWMTRGGKGGTQGEFDSGLSIRWKSGGGDSVVRFRSATAAIEEWQKVMRKCTFTTLDALDFLAECKKRDIPENGIYVDAPWPDDGDKYTYAVDQRKLAEVLASFEKTRVVVRFGDDALIHALYPESRWTWNLLESRTQANKAKAEVLLTNWRPNL